MRCHRDASSYRRAATLPASFPPELQTNASKDIMTDRRPRTRSRSTRRSFGTQTASGATPPIHPSHRRSWWSIRLRDVVVATVFVFLATMGTVHYCNTVVIPPLLDGHLPYTLNVSASTYHLPIPMEALAVLNFPSPEGVLNLPIDLYVDPDNTDHRRIVRRHFNRMMMYWHPDKIAKTGFPKELNTKILTALIWARATLMNSDVDAQRDGRDFLDGWDRFFRLTELRCGWNNRLHASAHDPHDADFTAFWPPSVSRMNRWQANRNGWFYNVYKFWRVIRSKKPKEQEDWLQDFLRQANDSAASCANAETDDAQKLSHGGSP